MAKNDIPAALADAECAASIARALGNPLAEGSARRALGQALYAAGHEPEAEEAFKQSLALLESCDSYETARTLAQWGALLPDAEATGRAAQPRGGRGGPGANRRRAMRVTGVVCRLRPTLPNLWYHDA
jgi:hypothetical protein